MEVATGLERARIALRERQREFARMPPRSSHIEDSVSAMRQIWTTRETEEPNRVRRGVMSFDKETERQRLARAEAIIRRVEPGANEDINYLGILSYQAASVEQVLLNLATTMGVDPERLANLEDRFARILFGTVSAARINAFSDTRTETGYSVVGLHSGLIDFMYQAAKTVSEVVPHTRGSGPGPAFKSDMDLDGAVRRVREVPQLAERVAEALEGYYFEGYPRKRWNEAVLDESGPALSSLIGMAERWVIAHEYGHTFAMVANVSDAPNPLWAEEYFSDNWATVATVWSAWTMDSFSPEVALSGATFALACLEVARRGHSLVTAGVTSKDVGSSTHPPNQARAIQCVDTFRQFFDVSYPLQGPPDYVAFTPRDKRPPSHGFRAEHSARAFRWARILLEAVWPVAGQRLKNCQGDRTLHAMWR